MQDLCSVIMCTYKQSNTLPLAWNGLFSQTYPNIEFIVVSVEGDEETDRVLEKLEGVKWIKADRPNLTYQRNLGAKIAKGDWIMFCDSDDHVMPIWISQPMITAKQKDALLVYCGYVVLDETMQMILRVYNPPEYSYDRLTQSCFIPDDTLFAKRLYDEFGPLREEVHPASMYDFWLKIAEKYPNRISCNPNPTVFYRYHEKQHRISQDGLNVRARVIGESLSRVFGQEVKVQVETSEI